MQVSAFGVQVSGFHLQVSMIAFALLASVAEGSEALEKLGVDVHGFADTRAGVRTQDDPNQSDDSLGEVRLQLDAQRFFDAATLQLRADFLYDWALDDTDVDLEEGKGFLDLREANVVFSPLQMVDVKLGRQILTWGTGDLVFINDLFPKDFQSFFIGRDEEYLKAPSDALFVSIFHGWVNLDIAYTPRFDADRFISGERISFFNPEAGGRIGEDDEIRVERPDDWLSDDELALRLSRNAGGYELAAYGYRGFWKSPHGANSETGEATFPELQVYGASVRGQVADGIGNVETGYYDSLDDGDGDDSLIPNSEARILVGYQREMARDLTATVQYYLGYMMDHDAFALAVPDGQPVADEDRHVLTLRLTKLLWSQNLTLSFVSLYSPSDQDAYVRPIVSYKVSDDWLVTAGGNVFLGRDDHTFFGQFEDNNNVYAGARYSF